MKKYYKMAIEYDNVNAMFNLGRYYQFIEINQELMEKYYLLANESYALYNLGYYYEENKNYDFMIKKLKIFLLF